MLVDAVPFNLPDVLSDLYTTSSMSGATEHGTTFDLPAFNAWLNDDNRSTYKFVDVRLTVGRHSDGTMLLERQEKSNARPQWTTRLRHEAFLTFQKLGPLRGAAAKEEDPPFYHLVPSLIQTWPCFARLNEFAKVLAYVRWLKANDASWEGVIPEPEKGPVLTSLIILGPDEYGSVDRSTDWSRLAETVRERAAMMIAADQFAQRLNDTVHRFRVKRLHTRRL